MKQIKLIVISWLLMVLFPLSVTAKESIDFVLDWVPNTNHTGLYVALEKGYFDDANLEINIKRPGEGSAIELVGINEGQFGINFQEYLGDALANGLPITAVAAIIEENTAGFLSNKDAEIINPQKLANTRLGTWNVPVELAMIKYLMTENDADFETLSLIPNDGSNTVVSLANNQFDSAIIYYAWDGLMAENQGIETNFFYLKDFSDELNFYSPVIIANNDYLAEHPQQARDFIQAVKKGYQFAMENPVEAADILIKHAPELQDERDFIIQSQEWLANHYASNSKDWGLIDENRWENFFKWAFEQELLGKDVSGQNTSTNEYVE